MKKMLKTLVKHFRREEDFSPLRSEIAKNTFLTKIKVGLKTTASWPLSPLDIPKYRFTELFPELKT